MFDITLLDEPDQISLPQLARRAKVHGSTPWRWALKGINGHVLPTAKHGGRRVTTLTAYQNWLVAINGEPAARSQTPRQRQRQIELAEQKAEEMGL
jgi:Protein of unknown function (DUF1580)